MYIKNFICAIVLLFACNTTLQSQTIDARNALLIANSDSIKQLIRITELAIAERKLILNIFMNPESNEFLIHFKPNTHSLTSVNWYNQNQQLIYKQAGLVADEKNEIKLTIQAADLQLSKGSYLVLIRNKDKVYIKRMVFY
ncbi:T9SS type A sorting domain-containing protein [Aurantibacillus circumpalustris]|uniref:T9SS type A sorting domain-containing protein n=1 Tax=Aurantibacillus circumpalustris TaxID=3036359 RepID=UPI00295B7E1B|nr:T9SS type A sorting domain-containing protein [Aurantibacillus circumpalustris]